MRRVVPWIVCSLAVVAPAASAQGPGGDGARVRAAYAKREVRIPMRDGTELFTAVYTPRAASGPVPVLLMRTPYSIAPYGADAYPAQLGPFPGLDAEPWIFVYQDVRGRYMSPGYYSFMTPHRGPTRRAGEVDEATDTYDTIDWVLKNIPGHNGRVGSWGNSAPGFFVAAGMLDAHPAHALAYPSAPMIDWWLGDDRHMNGLFKLSQTYNFLRNFDQPRDGPVERYPAGPDPGTTDGYAWHLRMGALSNYSRGPLQGRVAFWDSIAAHPDYDAYWQARSIWRHVKDVNPAVLTVGGWYDVEDPYGPFRLNQSLEETSRGTRRMFVVGPWSHGGWNRGDFESFGAFAMGSATGRFFRDSVGMPTFRCLLKDRCDGFRFGGALAFEAGANRWRRFDAWPPATATRTAYYLGAGGAFAATRPAAAGVDRYVSDPAKPVPYTAGHTFGFNAQYPTEDQRFASRRPDVLVYRSEVLTRDVTVAGPVRALLHVSSTGTDADFVVKLIDEYPGGVAAEVPGGPRLDGYERLVRPGVARARWRRGYERSVPLVANQSDSVSVPLDDVFHTFKAGHRIVIHVQSTWYPAVDRNPQVFVPNIYRATDTDFRAATMTIHRGGVRASRVELPLLP
jgi:hypothetical protein